MAALVSTPDVAKDLFSGLWDQAADKELYQAYTNLDSCSRASKEAAYIPPVTYTTTVSYIPPVCSAPSPVYCAAGPAARSAPSPAYCNPNSPVSTDSTCSENSAMNTHPYYPGPMSSTSPLTNRYTQLALLLVSQSQGQALSREEEEKRRVRRERNKVAATKCREKRKAHSVYVRHEYTQVTDTTKKLEEQINNLKREREELMRLLDTHDCVNPELGRSDTHLPQQQHTHHQLQAQLQPQQMMQQAELYIKSEPMYHQ